MASDLCLGTCRRPHGGLHRSSDRTGEPVRGSITWWRPGPHARLATDDVANAPWSRRSVAIGSFGRRPGPRSGSPARERPPRSRRSPPARDHRPREAGVERLGRRQVHGLHPFAIPPKSRPTLTRQAHPPQAGPAPRANARTAQADAAHRERLPEPRRSPGRSPRPSTRANTVGSNNPPVAFAWSSERRTTQLEPGRHRRPSAGETVHRGELAVLAEPGEAALLSFEDPPGSWRTPRRTRPPSGP